MRRDQGAPDVRLLCHVCVCRAPSVLLRERVLDLDVANPAGRVAAVQVALKIQPVPPRVIPLRRRRHTRTPQTSDLQWCRLTTSRTIARAHTHMEQSLSARLTHAARSSAPHRTAPARSARGPPTSTVGNFLVFQLFRPATIIKRAAEIRNSRNFSDWEGAFTQVKATGGGRTTWRGAGAPPRHWTWASGQCSIVPWV